MICLDPNEASSYGNCQNYDEPNHERPTGRDNFMVSRYLHEVADISENSNHGRPPSDKFMVGKTLVLNSAKTQRSQRTMIRTRVITIFRKISALELRSLLSINMVVSIGSSSDTGKVFFKSRTSHTRCGTAVRLIDYGNTTN